MICTVGKFWPDIKLSAGRKKPKATQVNVQRKNINQRIMKNIVLNQTITQFAFQMEINSLMYKYSNKMTILNVKQQELRKDKQVYSK